MATRRRHAARNIADRTWKSAEPHSGHTDHGVTIELAKFALASMDRTRARALIRLTSPRHTRRDPQLTTVTERHRLADPGFTAHSIGFLVNAERRRDKHCDHHGGCKHQNDHDCRLLAAVTDETAFGFIRVAGEFATRHLKTC